MILKLKIFFLLIFVFSLSQAQNVAIGQWRVHLPYNQGLAVAEAGNKIYCAARNGGLFSYNKIDNSIEKLSKINGLSDVNVTNLRYNKNIDALLIAYDNSNMDIIKNNSILNISDIKRKNIPGNKRINAISFYGEFAYLSCGFGIVVLDMNRNEIKDTYIIGPFGNTLEIFDVTNDGTFIYAATANGVYKASANNQNLSNYAEWQVETGLPTTKFRAIISFSNKTYAISETSGGNNLYVLDGGSWSIFDAAYPTTVKSIEVFYNKLLITDLNYMNVYGAGAPGGKDSLLLKYGQPWYYPNDAILDKDGILWFAVGYPLDGFYKCRDIDTYEPITLNGPLSNSSVAMTAQDDNLWVAPGGQNTLGAPLYNADGVFNFDNTKWVNYNRSTIDEFKNITDILSITIDPNDSKHVFLSTWGTGLVDFKPGNTPIIYMDSTSSLQGVSPSNVRVSGSAFDSKNNLWVSNSEVSSPLSVKMTNGKWQNFSLGTNYKGVKIGAILVDNNDQKWIITTTSGIVVYNDNNTISDISDDKIKILNDKVGEGKLPDINVNCFVLDDDGAIWTGTDKGICVFFNPGNVFTNPDAQQILIQQDGHFQNLLETEAVTAIAIDGGNRKWIGTKNSGVYLMSPDGTIEISHFDITNSPLLSNSIYSIAINNKSGEVYFGTGLGLMSYKGTATKGEETFESASVYPNPVREDYTGTIAIKGLVKNVNVKITDISGNILYETKALGGQAVWDGKNFDGKKAQTGVYIVFCTNEDGTQTFVTKILFIN